VTWRRLAVVCVLAIAAGVTVLAQRGVSPVRQRNGSGAYLANVPYDGRFVFVRMSYPTGFGGGFSGRGGAAWAHDYPTGEYHFMQILTTVTNVAGHVGESSVLAFDDPEVFKFPVIYLVEPGYWVPSEEQVTTLREYLTKGGFLIVDDFPYWAWENFAEQMARVFPAAQWQDLDVSHPIFHSFFEIATLDIVPAYDNLIARPGDRPIFRALFEQNDPARRMQVIANYQNDLSEFWEFSEQGTYAIAETNEAYKVGVNEFMFGITH
jgi:hypothetical protein